MASSLASHPQRTEVSCDASGDGGTVMVKIQASKATGQGSAKRCKYSISSSGSSAESSARRAGGGGGGGGRRHRRLPQLFERASCKWWDPRFDSSNLEEACAERCLPQTQRRFRYALFYMVVACLLWSIYFGVHMPSRWLGYLLPISGFLLACLGCFAFTFSRLYARRCSWLSLLVTLMVFALTLASQLQVLSPVSGRELLNRTSLANSTCLSQVGSFSLSVEVLLLLYSVMHLPLYLSLFLGITYSVLFETLGYQFRNLACFPPSGSQAIHWELLSKALLHVCVHAIGIHLFIMSEVRSRSTFLKVGQSIMHGKDLEVEKALKERMIHSVMPRIIADDLMKPGDDDSENSVKRHSTSSPKSRKKKSSIQKTPIIFRPFKMQRIEQVSILFADIVGFTKMSANKSAHALVGLLNDLFGRFDRLCEDTKCEKISTLGDCYYCVAGCPEPRQDHAYCCIEMGLGMIAAIEQFCQEKKEMVNMRVGVHTGTVLCGILGMRRFKFDVWSNDVNLANLMEQLGVAGKVHISEATAKYLDDRYQMEDSQVVERVGPVVVADQLKGLKTYLISGRRTRESSCNCCSQILFSAHHTGDNSSSSLKLHTALSPENTDNLSQANNHPEKHKTCPSCSVTFAPNCDVGTEEGAVQNGCQDEHKYNASKAPVGRNPKTQNGLLSPPRDEKLTNSQTSLYEMLQEKGRWCGVSMDQSALLPLRFKNIREKTDAHFVDVIKEDSLMKDYFFKPPINRLSLNFLDQDLEKAYRASYQEEVVRTVPVKTFASATFSSLLDVLLSTFVFLILSITCFLKHWGSNSSPPLAAVIVFAMAILLALLSLIISIRMVFFLEEVMVFTKRLLEVISGWLPRHFIGAILVSLPAIAVFSHFTSEFETNINYTMFLCSALLITIIQYCNFCQLSSWMRSSLATIVGIVLLILLYIPWCTDSSLEAPQLDRTQNFSSRKTTCNGSLASDTEKPSDRIGQEVILAFFLLLLLVWFLNREFEVSYRLHYHGDVEADLHRTKIQSMRDQADWLLRNIIPYHVAEQLKVSQSYSKNHDNVGVIFASIVNFSEFYEENYEGGKECYRVLNELIGDFDELLSKPHYSSIEKIKTIGATYMAASGLNPSQCQDSSHPHGHLQTLFEFAKEMMRVVDDFNNNMLWFNFKLRIGFNHGPLTAGVIGTTKLLYDIWGDTVNIASRMDTTGVECRIQVSEESYRILCKMGYDFDYRGTVNVKGKGQMKTFLYPKCMDNGIVPHHQLSISPDIRVQVDGSIGRSPTDEITSLVPSVQSSDKSSHCSENTEMREALLVSQKLHRDPAKKEEQSRLCKTIEDGFGEMGMEEADELTKLNSSEKL
ncbi:adenylate cyclase type 9 isoform X2 [Microcaecilia unicolor]|uniref:Adenylate cyclase type 9 n=1 Tax=Microcaecilia unicolor TaxID=1415580 RepID=A0A6P7YXN3_9AMPH|nr:adenylate cyclase type 9 isoform X2 [Microcaecilia unicolor]